MKTSSKKEKKRKKKIKKEKVKKKKKNKKHSSDSSVGISLRLFAENTLNRRYYSRGSVIEISKHFGTINYYLSTAHLKIAESGFCQGVYVKSLEHFRWKNPTRA